MILRGFILSCTCCMNILASESMGSSCLSPICSYGYFGTGFFNASINSQPTHINFSVIDMKVIPVLSEKKKIISEICYFLVVVTYIYSINNTL